MLILTSAPMAILAAENYQTKLWAIKQKGHIKGYLLGTIHIPKHNIWRDVYGLPDVLDTEVKRVIFEIRFDVVLRIPGGCNSFGHLKDQGLKSTINQISGNSIHDDTSLWIIYFSLIKKLYRIIPWNPIFEHQIYEQVISKGLRHYYLDEPQQLIQRFNRVPIIELELAIREVLTYISKKNAGTFSMDQVIQEYWSGESARKVHSNTGMSQFIKIMIFERSRQWLPNIIGHLNAESTLIVVGAAHLNGQQGLIQLLSDKGYELTPVTNME